jgi:hypothetical protein
MNFIRQRHARAASSTITKVPRNPNLFDAPLQCRFKKKLQVLPAQARRVRAVMHLAAISIWIEDAWQPYLGETADKAAGCQSGNLE